jgi:hypothetical protein
MDQGLKANSGGRRFLPARLSRLNRHAPVEEDEMHDLHEKDASLRAAAAGLIACCLAFSHARAEPDETALPPYQIAGSHHITVDVIWDARQVRRLLPPGIEPTPEMTGGIDIYQTERGYGLGAYHSAYFYVDVLGFDSPDGTRGRWKLEGVYGPNPKVTDALQTHFGWAISNGSATLQRQGDTRIASGTRNGKIFVTVKIERLAGGCQTVSGIANYPGMPRNPNRIAVITVPFTGQYCPAKPVSVDIQSNGLVPTKILSAAELRDFSYAFAEIPRTPAR